MDFVSAHKQIN